MHRRRHRRRAGDADRRRDPAPSPARRRACRRAHGGCAATGSGFGTRRLSGISNVLRVVVYDGESGWRQDEQVAVLGFEVDDQSPEELALGLEALRAAEGVLDVVQLPALGKKGRLAAQIQVLARPERLDAVIERCFVETTTIGLRWRIEARAVLAREVVEVATADGAVPVKIVTRPGGSRTAKGEMDQVSGDGHAARSSRRRAAEARALERRGGGLSERRGEVGRTRCGARGHRHGRGRGERRRRQHDARGRGRAPAGRPRGDGARGIARGAARGDRPRRGPMRAREGWRLAIIDAGEFADPDYLANPANRCFFCKTNLYGAIAARTEATIVSGTNLDDLGDWRPGLRRRAAHGVRHPYVEAGDRQGDGARARARHRPATTSPSCRRRPACPAGSRPASR